MPSQRDDGLNSTSTVGFNDACALLETRLSGPFRQEISSDLTTSADLRTALSRLRNSMRANVWKAGSQTLDLNDVVKVLDNRTRREGFHALHDWDGKAGKVNRESLPVNVLDYMSDHRGSHRPDQTSIAILLDYYFVYLLGLLSLRIWDAGDPDDNLDRLNRLLSSLQGPHGSGQPFVDNAETLLLIATSHYEANEEGYVTLLRRVRTLNQIHQLKISVVHAASMGCHLRFGFEAPYGRDTVLMRDDNVADYPWVCYALATVMQEYSRLRTGDTDRRARRAVVEAMLLGLSPDVRAFVGASPPSSLAAAADTDRREIREVFHTYCHDLIAEFEGCRPSERAFSPFSFFFNFAQNVLKGTIVDALLWKHPWALNFNDLLTGQPHDDAKMESKTKLATTLMTYARTNPDTIRGRLMPAIVYDPQTGRQAFAAALRQLKREASDA